MLLAALSTGLAIIGSCTFWFRGPLWLFYTVRIFLLDVLLGTVSRKRSSVSPRNGDTVSVPLNDPRQTDTYEFRGYIVDRKGFITVRLERRLSALSCASVALELEDLGVFNLPMARGSEFPPNERQVGLGGLQLEVLKGLQTWTIHFDGEVESSTDNRRHHLSLALRWRPFNSSFTTFDASRKCRSAVLASLGLPAFSKGLAASSPFLSGSSMWEQWGEFRGRIRTDGRMDRLLCRGPMSRICGDFAWGGDSFKRLLTHRGYFTDGTCVTVTVVLVPNLGVLASGCVWLPNGIPLRVLRCSASPNLELKNLQSFQYSVLLEQGTSLTVRGHVVAPLAKNKLERPDGAEIKGCSVQLSMGTKTGYGSVEVVTSGTPSTKATKSSSEVTKDRKYIIRLSDPDASNQDLVGGKATQLHFLQALNQSKFTVPRGFCVTTAAHDLLVEQSSVIQDLLRQMDEADVNSTRLEKLCERLREAYMTEALPTRIMEDISFAFYNYFKSDESLKLAVRSSGISEDLASASCAGQFDTILGVQGLDAILESVRLCWASQYGFRAVQYRKNQSQNLRSSMCAIVQELVDAEVAGVLFTAHPVNGDTTQCVLNASWGLGEAVVADLVNPDTFSIQKEPLKVVDSCLGHKTKMVVVRAAMKGKATGGGAETVEVPQDRQHRCCISEKDVLRLCQAALEVENEYRSPRDIEWAMNSSGELFLLQARPITTLGLRLDTDDDEIMHEFDTALASETEWVSTANIGEMVPGALTPLTLTTFLPAVEYGMQTINIKSGAMLRYQELFNQCSIYYNHAFFNMHALGCIHTHVDSTKKSAYELSLCGGILHDHKEEDVRNFHHPISWLATKLNSLKFLRVLFKSKKIMKKVAKKIDKLDIFGSNKSSMIAKDMFQAIDRNLPFLSEAWAATIAFSSRSGSWSSIMMMILSTGEDWHVNQYADVAKLLSQCSGVVSADVPTDLEHLADAILGSYSGEIEFEKLGSAQALAWLRSRVSGTAGKSFAGFIDKQGHRCVRESEMREKSWGQDPEKLMSVLQSVVASRRMKPKSARKESSAEEDPIDTLASKPTMLKKLIIRAILPKARTAVGEREWGKSTTIKVNNAFKQAYWQLGAKLVQESRLPDEDLLFFLTHKEIGIVSTSPRSQSELVQKAIHRRRVHQQLSRLNFKDMNVGPPVPLPIDQVGVDATKAVTGMPVSSGVAIGKARVVTCLADASGMKAGEVLIAPYTDVGWAPYFPLACGLVTELGGMLSHGAVVAREYGIPCVVNVVAATRSVKTGDEVEVNGSKGTLRILKRASEE